MRQSQDSEIDIDALPDEERRALLEGLRERRRALILTQNDEQTDQYNLWRSSRRHWAKD